MAKFSRLTYFIMSLFLLPPSLFARSFNLVSGKIVLDAGHGGTDSGTVSPFGLKEKDINWRVVRYLGLLLEKIGFTVEYTRRGDTTLTLADRVEIAKKVSPDFFLSVHHNSTLGDRRVNRTEIYYKMFDERQSYQLGRAFLRTFPELFTPNPLVILPGSYFVLRNNPFPAILGEASYLSQAENARKSERTTTVIQEAWLYYRGLVAYFRDPPPAIEVHWGRDENSSDPILHGRVTGRCDPDTLSVRCGGEMWIRKWLTSDQFMAFPFLSPSSGDYSVEISAESPTGMKSRLYREPLHLVKPVVRTEHSLFFHDSKGHFITRWRLLDSSGHTIGDERPFALIGPTGEMIASGVTKGIGPWVPIPLVQPGIFSLRLGEAPPIPISLDPIGVPRVSLLKFQPSKGLEFPAILGVDATGREMTADSQGVMVLSSVSYPLKISPPPGFEPFTLWRDPEYLEPLLATRDSPDLVGYGLVVDWTFVDSLPLKEGIAALRSHLEPLGVKIFFAGDGEFPYTQIERVQRANQFPGNLYLLLKHRPKVGFIKVSHYPKSPIGQKGCAFLAERFKDPQREGDFFGAGSDYPLTNTTASALIIEGDFHSPRLSGFQEVGAALLRHLTLSPRP